MTYTDAIAALEKSGKTFEFPVQWGIDLQSEHERWLTEEHVKAPVVVMNYPKEIKAFYMRMNDDGKTVAAMDVLAPGIGEIIGGSQREERLDELDRRLAELHLDPKALLVVPRPAPLRHRAARRLRPRLRAHDHLRDGHGEHPRRDPVPAHAGTGGVLNSVDILEVVNSESDECFLQPLARLGAALQHIDRIAGVCHLEHQHAVVADLLRLHHRRVPVDRAGKRRQMIVALPAVVVHVRRPQWPESVFDRLAEVAHQVGVAVVEADADVEAVELVLRSAQASARGVGERVRNHFDRDANVHARRRRRRSPRRCGAQLRLVVGWRAAARSSGMPRCSDEVAERDLRGDRERRLRLCDRLLPAALVRRRVRERTDPSPLVHAPRRSARGPSAAQARVRQPFGQFRDRARSSW